MPQNDLEIYKSLNVKCKYIRNIYYIQQPMNKHSMAR